MNKNGKLYVFEESEFQSILEIVSGVAAERAIEVFHIEKEKEYEERVKKCRNSAKLLIVNYKRLKKMEFTSVYDADTVTNETLEQLFDSLLGRVKLADFDLTSTDINRIKTGMLMNHVDVQIENYKHECELSKNNDFARRYRIIEMMYLREDALSAEEAAEIELIDKSNVYRTLEKAYDDLAVLFFGIDGATMVEYSKKKRNEERRKKKRSSL